jgi:PadR family transcriptional regulator PadR
MGTEKPKADFLPGTLDMLRVEAGSLYPALQRLELTAWIEGEWGLSAWYRQVTGAVVRIMGFA